MKKLLLPILMGVTIICYSQENDTTGLASERKHEIRIDALEGLAVPALDLSYEYVISKYSGAGISTFINLSGDESNDYQTFTISPYYRQYFFNKKDYGARGLFAEGLLQLGTGGDNYGDDFDEEPISVRDQDPSWTAFGIGFAIGQKWVSKNGFVLEISIGGGRYFGSEEGAPEGFIKGGILVGYRIF